MNEAEELAMAGYHKVYDYTQYSHENHVNIIPEDDFKHLVRDTFKYRNDYNTECPDYQINNWDCGYYQ